MQRLVVTLLMSNELLYFDIAQIDDVQALIVMLAPWQDRGFSLSS